MMKIRWFTVCETLVSFVDVRALFLEQKLRFYDLLNLVKSICVFVLLTDVKIIMVMIIITMNINSNNTNNNKIIKKSASKIGIGERRMEGKQNKNYKCKSKEKMGKIFMRLYNNNNKNASLNPIIAYLTTS